MAKIPGCHDVTLSAVKRQWRNYKQSILFPEKHTHDVNRKEGSGTRRKIASEELYRLVKAVPFSERQTFHSLAYKIDMPISTHRLAFKKGLL